MTDVTNKVALVTGGASGIGLGIARALTVAGAAVIVADIDKYALERVKSEGAAIAAAFVELDVTRPDAWDRALDECEASVGPVGILCNNAGVSALGTRIEDLSIAYWDRVFQVNVTSVLVGTQKVLSRMRSRGATGHILNTASVAGVGITTEGAAAYTASKYAVVALSEVLDREMASLGIGVSVLCPGPVRTQLWRTSRSILGLSELSEPPEGAREFGSASDSAMDPLEAGRIAVEGIVKNQAYIFTDDQHRLEVERRHGRILAAFDVAAVSNSSIGRLA